MDKKTSELSIFFAGNRLNIKVFLISLMNNQADVINYLGLF